MTVASCRATWALKPFPDAHFDYVTAFDLFEHIDRVVSPVACAAIHHI
jgi:hypothetical protein